MDTTLTHHSRINPALFLVAAILALGHASLAHAADCILPKAVPTMPQGATASEDEMKAGREELQAFVNVLQAYSACMDKLVKDAPPNTPAEQKQKWQAESDYAIETAERVSNIYSAQLRAFKSR